MVVESFVYADRADGALSLNVFKPSGDVDRSTAVLHLHGGGWRAGSPELLNPRSNLLAARGYTVVQVQYRLLNEAVRWPAPVIDLRSALRWVWTHADELGVRRDAIVLWGHSAGAHICLMTTATLADSGLDDPRDDSSVPVSVAAVIDCYAAVSFYPGSTPLFVPGPAGLDFARIAANQRSDGALPGIDLLAERCSERQARAISPLKHVDARFPPTMIVHGTDDKLILPTNSQRLDHVLSNLGAVSQLVTFAGCSHEFDMAPSYAAVLTGHIDLFLRRVLADPDLAAEVAEYGAFA